MRQSLLLSAWKRLLQHRMAVVGLVVVVLYALGGFILPNSGLLYPYDEQVIDHRSLPPSWDPAGKVMLEVRYTYLQRLLTAQNRQMTDQEKDQLVQWRADVATNPIHQRHYWLGTDSLGRDLLSRVVYGGQISMLVGLVGTLTAVLIGILYGAFAGYVGRWIDNGMMRFVDVMYGLPYMLLVIIMRALFGRDNVTLFIAIALISWLTVARVVRAQVMSLKNAEFVQAARTMGAGPGRIIFRHMVPNTLGIVMVFTTLLVPSFIISESFLSFLGLGVSAPLASWGSLMSDAVKVIQVYPWELIFPALAMTVFLISVNFLGDGLRDALDPHTRTRT